MNLPEYVAEVRNAHDDYKLSLNEAAKKLAMRLEQAHVSFTTDPAMAVERMPDERRIHAERIS